MWTRSELKNKGKFSFKQNYWKAVLVGLIAALVAGGSASISGASSGASIGNVLSQKTQSESYDNTYDYSYDDTYDDFDDTFDEDGFYDDDADSYADDVYDDINNPPVEFSNGTEELPREAIVAIIAFAAVFLLIMLAIAIVVHVLLFIPLEVGACRFFTRNLNEKAEVKEVAFGYDNGYKNNVVTLLLRDVYTFLWSLLFIIPGIIKAYEYRMIPYILADHPDISRKEAFAHSKMLMQGNKWKAFVLDLSFIGWHLLSALTCGILEIFYVGPYFNATRAALYEALENGSNAAAAGVSPFTQSPITPVDPAAPIQPAAPVQPAEPMQAPVEQAAPIPTPVEPAAPGETPAEPAAQIPTPVEPAAPAEGTDVQ